MKIKIVTLGLIIGFLGNSSYAAPTFSFLCNLSNDFYHENSLNCDMNETSYSTFLERLEKKISTGKIKEVGAFVIDTTKLFKEEICSTNLTPDRIKKLTFTEPALPSIMKRLQDKYGVIFKFEILSSSIKINKQEMAALHAHLKTLFNNSQLMFGIWDSSQVKMMDYLKEVEKKALEGEIPQGTHCPIDIEMFFAQPFLSTPVHSLTLADAALPAFIKKLKQKYGLRFMLSFPICPAMDQEETDQLITQLEKLLGIGKIVFGTL